MSGISFASNFASLPETFSRPCDAETISDPRLFAFNAKLAEELGLAATKSSELAKIFTGQQLPPGTQPVAMAYAGHQFGNFVPQLGDGRALLIGELTSDSQKMYDIHLKGSGRTPFSRGGDGKSQIGPVIREYLLCEAMHRLGVPTTRALAAATTGEQICRGHDASPGAIFTRVAASHIRVGTFEYFAARRDEEALSTLLQFASQRLYPDLPAGDPVAFLERVVDAQTRLVAKWMSLGFIHGVMNTDNTSIAGETIDYGPCAFMDEFRFDQVFSSIDHRGRYAYDQQPHIAQWNCARLADCLSLMLGEMGFHKVDGLRILIEEMPSVYQAYYIDEMRPKFGLLEPDENDTSLVTEWLQILERENLDFTNSFRHLSEHLSAEGQSLPASLDNFLVRWRQRVQSQGKSIAAVTEAMNAANPIYIPRNHLVEQAIREGKTGDYKFFNRLQQVLDRPFILQKDVSELTRLPNDTERVAQTFCGT